MERDGRTDGRSKNSADVSSSLRRAAALLSLAAIALTNATPAERQTLAARCCRLAADLRDLLGPAPIASGGARG